MSNLPKAVRLDKAGRAEVAQSVACATAGDHGRGSKKRIRETNNNTQGPNGAELMDIERDIRIAELEATLKGTEAALTQERELRQQAERAAADRQLAYLDTDIERLAEKMRRERIERRAVDLKRRLEVYREGFKAADFDSIAFEIQRNAALYFLIKILGGLRGDDTKEVKAARRWLDGFMSNVDETERVMIEVVPGAIIEAADTLRAVEWPEELEDVEV